MANERPSTSERAIGLVMRLLLSLVLPVWGLATIGAGVADGNHWWIATGAVVLTIGVLLFAVSSLVSPLIAGRAHPQP
jgi:hypothetical protein